MLTILDIISSQNYCFFHMIVDAIQNSHPKASFESNKNFVWEILVFPGPFRKRGNWGSRGFNNSSGSEWVYELAGTSILPVLGPHGAFTSSPQRIHA